MGKLNEYLGKNKDLGIFLPILAGFGWIFTHYLTNFVGGF